MFQLGDAVFHPVHGAGVITEIKERRSLGEKRYYSIRLLSQPKTVLMVPVRAAHEIGLRRSTPSSELGAVWRVLGGAPRTLPGDHEERYELIRGWLHGGDILQIAAAVRDMAGRQHQQRSMTKQGERLYEEGIRLLAGEIAVSQGAEFTAVCAQISEMLQESGSLGKAM